ncbi:MAG: Hsp20/alpha crystallin family protein [Anaerolineae bacterium]
MASIVRWTPFEDMVTLREAMERLFDESFVRPYRSGGNGNSSLAMARLPIDLYETDEQVVLKARLPGVNPEDVDITMDDGDLIIKAELRSDAALDEARKWNWHRHELYHGSIGRRISLPTQVQADKIEATFRNGELSLVLPKAEEVKPRSIKVKAVK